MTEDAEVKVRAQVEYLREMGFRPRTWALASARQALTTLVLFLGLWGLNVEPVAAARAAVGLWWLGMVGFAVLMAFVGGISAAMGMLFDTAKAAERKP